MKWDEKGCGTICGIMFDMPTSQIRAPETHKSSAGVAITEWKWERITMDFVVGLPKTQKGHDSIWVIVDRLTKSAHFLAVKTTYTVAQYAQMYLDSIVALHGVPVSIVSDRGP